jgi:hypothetical protein
MVTSAQLCVRIGVGAAGLPLPHADTKTTAHNTRIDGARTGAS